MSPTMTSLGIDRLDAADRLRLAEELWESVAAEEEAAPIDEALRSELSRRLQEHRDRPEDAIPWEAIKAEALARFRK